MATLEQVERLREKANVSYDDAKAALEASNDDILDAIIHLEKQGKIAKPEGGGYYKSADYQDKDNSQSKTESKTGSGESFSGQIKRFGKFIAKIIHKGNINTFEVLRKGEVKVSFPVTVLALLVIFTFWITIPLLIIGLFFDCRYHFRGPDLGRDTINNTMDNVSNATENIKKSFNNEK